jgi:hypothetical protein
MCCFKMWILCGTKIPVSILINALIAHLSYHVSLFESTVPFFHDKINPLYDFDMFFQDDGARSLRYAPYSANTGKIFGL